MPDKIKVVYSWIGPRGPMMNTELPNILSMAAVATGANTSSHNFWADNIWHVIFNNKEEDYTLSPTMMIDDRDTYIFPFTLTWRIPFEAYFLPNSGIMEFSHCPQHIIHHVRNSKGYFLLDMSAETYVKDQQLDLMHSYFRYHNGIPMNKIIYLTGCMNAQELYNDYCNRRGISQDERMILISFPISQDALAIHLASNPPIPEYDVNKVPEKLFLTWNRRFRPHRTMLTLGLEKLNLVDRSYVSMCDYDPENRSISFRSTVRPDIMTYLDLSEEIVNRFTSKLPLVLDGEKNVNQMCQDFNNAARNFYQNSLVSIITETNFDLPELSLTEKSFKPFKEKHPFLVMGVPGCLKALRDFGFKTFNEFWDEGYDEIGDPFIRMNAILRICEDISRWDEHKIRDFRSKVKPILDHNYEALKVKSSWIVAKRIKNIINERYP
jgi:hypothetical protein